MFKLAALAIAGTLIAAPNPSSSTVPTQAAIKASRTVRRAALRRFEENQGQFPKAVRFVSRTPRGTLALGERDAAFHLSGATVRMAWTGKSGTVRGISPLPGVQHYLVGDRSTWRRGVPGFGRVKYEDVARGIDLEFYDADEGFEYDIFVHPGAMLSDLSLRFDGVTKIVEDAGGDLVLSTAAGSVRQRRPIAFQDIAGRRTPVPVRYDIHGNHVAFRAEAYDRTRTLVIDPTIAFSTYLGGSSDDNANAVAVDAAGFIYVTGSTASVNFPTASAMLTDAGGTDAFVSKLSPDGASLVYSTYLGGSAEDLGISLAVSPAGSAYVAGRTQSTNFPVAAPYQTGNAGYSGFVSRLSTDGSSLVFSTYLGGADFDEVHAVAIDPGGAAYVVGTTQSPDFPLQNALQTVPGRAFITKFSSAGALAYSTYFGSMGPPGSITAEFGVGLHAIAVDSSGAAYVGGDSLSATIPVTPGAYQSTSNGGVCVDPFLNHTPYPCHDGVVAKLSPSGGLVYATYLGNTTAAGGSTDSVSGITIDGNGFAYVVGTTWSPSFPTTPGAVQRGCASFGPECSPRVFVTKLNQQATGLVYSALLGGSGQTATGNIELKSPGTFFPAPAAGIALDALGQAVVTGWTTAADFPVVNPQQAALASPGEQDAFIVALSADATAVVYGTYLGGAAANRSGTYLGGAAADRGVGLATTPDGAIVVAGDSFTTDFPVSSARQPANAGGEDAFVVKLRFPQPLLNVDEPAEGATVFQSFKIGGWAVDRGAGSDAGVDGVHIWAYRDGGGAATFIGAPVPFVSRPDVAAWLGPQFGPSGFNAFASSLAPGTYTLAIYAHSSVTNTFAPPVLRRIQVASGVLVNIDTPTAGSTTYPGLNIGGWAIDRAAASNNGVESVHVWAYPNPGSGQAPIFLGVTVVGASRPDVGAIFGSRFTPSGFNFAIPALTAGPYLFAVFPYSTVTNSFGAPATVSVQVGDSRPNGSLDAPANGSTVLGAFKVEGWALDAAAPSGTGVNLVHVYAFPVGGGQPMFVGQATYGIARTDVGAIFGSRFTPSGFELNAAALPFGTYDLRAYAHSPVSNAFNLVGTARIISQ